MIDTSHHFSGSASGDDQPASDQAFLEAMRRATPTERIAWLEEALRQAYASGALEPRRFIGKEEWEATGSSPR
jgi:hypothetical protein